MRWWGWGDPGHPPALGQGMLRLLRDTVGTAQKPRPPVALARVKLAPAALPDGVRGELQALLGADGVREDHAERVAHAAGRGYPDLVRLRSGEPQGAPDAVVYPRTPAELRELLALCCKRSLAVVPFGGGTSVVGGVEPLKGEHAAVVALDMRHLADPVRIDGVSRIATVGAGMRAPALERRLMAHHLTLGHYPQSFEYVSLGGCAASGGAGQASTGYGRFAKLVVGMRATAPTGELAIAPHPASAAGPELGALLLGSEGTLAVIHELSLRVRAAPREQRYEGVFFADFTAGVDALRALAQDRTAPAVARLSDESETRIALAQADAAAGEREAEHAGWWANRSAALQARARNRAGRVYLRARGYGGGCLAIFGFEGEPAEVEHDHKRALETVRRHGGLALGSAPGEAWRRQRFAAPYLRDELLTHGVLVETLETATSWSNLLQLHRGVSTAIEDALRAQGTPGIVMCHVSHLYETGASLYFTLLARQREGAEIEQWRAVKRAAGEAIANGGGTISHHHGVGRDHRPWMAHEHGERGIDALRALKRELDPAGIMNPGKLLP
ncbi:MAG TPA: FAD-binding oxidoreductase [Solirubrobacteraceae bacterium]|jgi:alkyldihydroxyacetonephosphate synthase|nr:FAD-binding oxidoreductase [Solirubrobacteraceae bacterium]